MLAPNLSPYWIDEACSQSKTVKYRGLMRNGKFVLTNTLIARSTSPAKKGPF